MRSDLLSVDRVWFSFVLLLGLCALLYLPGISLRDLWAPDEVRYTEVAREMDITGSLALPRLNGEPYADKPPLFFWLVILVKKLLGQWSPVPARIVSFAGAIGTVVLTFFLARRLGLGKAGLVAGIVLATSAEFLWMARWGAMDTILSFLVLLCLYGFIVRRMGGSKHWLVVAYLAAGMAILVKGPLGALIPAVAIAITVVRTDGISRLKSGSLLWGVPLMLAPVALWLALAIHAGGESYGKEVLLDQNIGRISYRIAHHQPVYYYLVNFPLNFLPWTLFLPGALVVLFRDRSMPHETKVFLSAYFLGEFLFFSLLPTKREKYLLPIYPAVSLLVGHLLCCTGSVRDETERFIRIPGLILCWLAAVSGLASVTVGIYGLHIANAIAPEFSTETQAVIGATQTRVCLSLTGAILCVVGLGSLRLMKRRPETVSPILVFIFIFLISIPGSLDILPRANAFKSVRDFCEVLDQNTSQDTPVGIYWRTYEGAFNYYLGRTHLPVVSSPDALTRFLSGTGAPVVIIREKYLKEVELKTNQQFEVLHKKKFEHWHMAAITKSSSPH